MRKYSLEYEVLKIIDMVVNNIDSVESLDILTEYGHALNCLRVTKNFRGDRFGDKFFSPRPYEEDDDDPNFDGRELIINGLKKYLGKQCSVDAYHHEKGYFTVQVYIKNLNNGVRR